MTVLDLPATLPNHATTARRAAAAATTPLVGREVELGLLRGLIDSVEGEGAALVVRGEPGTGRSSLLAAAAEHARKAGRLVVRMTGIEAESALPYAGLHALLAPLPTAVDTLPAAQRRVLLTAFGRHEGPAPEPFLMALAALTLLTESAAVQPLMVVVDDLQWLDPPTIDVLAFLSRRVSGKPVLIVGAVRSGHADTIPFAGPRELELPALDDISARVLLGATAPDLSDADRETIRAQAGGNPLALVELPAAWRSTGPHLVQPTTVVMSLSPRLERAFASGIDELPGPTRDAILVAAVDSDGELAGILAATTLLAGQPVTAAVLEPAEAVGLLRFDELHVRFRHPLVRSGIFQNESVSRRQRAHAALGDVLHASPLRRIHHRGQAVVGPDDALAAELEASQNECIRRGDVGAAISALERSAQLTTSSELRGRRLLMAAQHAYGLGRADLVDQLVAAAERNELSDLDRARVVWLREIFSDGTAGDSARVVELCEISRRADAAGDRDLALELLLGAAMRCWWADAGRPARRQVVDDAERLVGVGDDPRRIAAIALAEPVLGGARTVAHLATLRTGTVTDANDLRLLGLAARAVGDETRSADFLAQAETLLRDQGRHGLLCHVLAVQAAVHLDLGDWRRAGDGLAEGRRLAEESGQPTWSAGFVVLEAWVAALTGDPDQAMLVSAEVELTSAAHAANDLLACVQLARGSAWLAVGRYDAAYAALRPVFEPEDWRHHQREQFSGIMLLAEAASRGSHRLDALAVMARMEELARTTPSPVLHTQLLYARPVLAADEDAERLFLDGLAHDLTRWPWVRARLQLAYGCWLRRQRRAAESRALLRSALHTLELIGATAWIAQTRAELAAAGERGSAVDGSPSTVRLSAQELQIARLAATGLSNREIAQQLYLSPRTVSSHLYHIFPKLNIRSRAQLAARVGELD